MIYNNTTPRLKIETCYLFVALLSLTLTAVGQDLAVPASNTRFDSSVVWNAPADFRRVFDDKCSSYSYPAFQECFLSLMREMGASPGALEFTRLSDTSGFVRKFVKSGVVDIAYVSYPFRANENFGVTLVNGRPDMIDVDDFQYVDLTALKEDSTYMRILDSFPDASVWPANRFDTNQVTCQSLHGSGQSFKVNYLIKNGCHACEDIGDVSYVFDFDSDGRFEGSRLLEVKQLAR